MKLIDYISFCKEMTSGDLKDFALINIYTKDIHGGLNTEDKDEIYSYVKNEWIKEVKVSQYIQPDRGPVIEKVISRSSTVLSNQAFYTEIINNVELLIKFLKQFDYSHKLHLVDN